MSVDLKDYSFYLWTSKTPPIKYLIELLRDLLTEGNLECSNTGIRIQAVIHHVLFLFIVNLKLKGLKLSLS